MQEPQLKIVRKNFLMKLFGLSLLFLSRCKTKSKSDPKELTSNPFSPKSQKTSTNSSNTLSETSTGIIPLPCATDENQTGVDLTQIVEGPEIYSVKTTLYGNLDRALLVLSMPMYQHGALQTIFICTEKGELIAQRAIDGINDIRRDKTLRALSFDGINLLGVKSFTFLLYLSSDQYYKFTNDQPLQFTNTFRNQKVISSYLLENNADVFPGYQDRLFFTSQLSGYYQQTLAPTTWLIDPIFFAFALDADTNLILTDLEGNLFYQKGLLDTFDLQTSNQLIAYYPTQKGYYIRTFLKIL